MTEGTRRERGSLYQRSSDGRWFGSVAAGFTASGTRRRITVSGKSKSVVQRRLRDKLAEQEQQGTSNVRRTITVAKWSGEWLSAIRSSVRPSAYETDKAAVRWITEAIGHIRLAELTPAHVRSVAAAVRSAGNSSSTALRYQGSLMRMLKAASRDGYQVAPNVLLAELPKKAVHDRQALALPQAIDVLAELTRTRDGAPVYRDSSRWSLAFLQGLRQAEALGLTWDEVDLSAGTLTVCWQAKALRYREPGNVDAGFQIPDGYDVRHLVCSAHLVRPKSRAGWRVMPLVPWAVTALSDWRDIAPDNPQGLVWPGRINAGGAWPRNPTSDRDDWQEIQEAAGVAHPNGRPYVVHEIRHTTATLLMELKVPESIRVAIMGHSSMASTHGYEHADFTAMLAPLEQVRERLQLG